MTISKKSFASAANTTKKSAGITADFFQASSKANDFYMP